jgi:hypothetical protein
MDVNSPIQVLNMPTRAGCDKANWDNRLSPIVVRIAILAVAQSCLTDQTTPTVRAATAGNGFLCCIPTREHPCSNEPWRRSLLGIIVVCRRFIEFKRWNIE